MFFILFFECYCQNSSVLVSKSKENSSTNEFPLIRKLAGIVIISTIPFSVLTYFIYAFISELRNLRGFILMSDVACICINAIHFSAYAFRYTNMTKNWNIFCINYGNFIHSFKSYKIQLLKNSLNLIIFIVIYFFFSEISFTYFSLAEYCWSTVMCFDIWQTFR